MKNVRYFVFAGAAALMLCAMPAAAENDPPPPLPAGAGEEVPDQATLQRLARRALQNVTGIRMRVGPVILRQKLADGSWLVDVTLESGRQVKGRLYRHRRRYRIVIDRRDWNTPEIKIVK